jgi:hypothetical protein
MHPFAILRAQPRTSLPHSLPPIATLVALSALASALTLLDLLVLLHRAVPLRVAVLLVLAIQARTILFRSAPLFTLSFLLTFSINSPLRLGAASRFTSMRTLCVRSLHTVWSAGPRRMPSATRRPTAFAFVFLSEG